MTMLPEKPYAPATDRNRDAVLAVLIEHFAEQHQVLEIGSGTGQHALYFARALPHLQWQCSDRSAYLSGIQQWLDEEQLANMPPAMELDVAKDWPVQQYDAVFSANTLHIMSWPEVESLFAGLGKILKPRSKLVIYGPFNYGGQFTSDSNQQFDQSLRAEDPRGGIRDFEAVDALASDIGLHLLEDRAMPANNRCLIWSRPQAN